MIRLFLWTSALLLFVGLSACRTRADNPSSLAADDSLRTLIRQRIEQKMELDRMRLKLLESGLGREILKYKPIIKKYSKRYGFDWRLIAAQIVQESGFRIKARSHKGASGLMQLMPQTAREISRELDIQYIMRNPRENITAGIYHLHKQYRLFPNADRNNRVKLALASYNAGAGRVFDAQDIARYYKRPPNVWENVRPYLAMLKKTDWQLHLQVWPSGKPRFGYFYGYNETINYVENIWSMYQTYRHIF